MGNPRWISAGKHGCQRLHATALRTQRALRKQYPSCIHALEIFPLSPGAHQPTGDQQLTVARGHPHVILSQEDGEGRM